MPTYILALDAGTTSSRAILYNLKTEIIAKAQYEFKQHFPKPGWVEHSPQDIWKSQLKAARNCLKKSGVNINDIAAVGITNQRETTLIWDRKTGEPVYNAIVWQDRRTTYFCEKLKNSKDGELIKKKTGLIPDAYFSATKIKWILEKDKSLMKKAQNGELCFGTVDSWLVWKLTGGKSHITDITNASRTMLYNIIDKKWDQELLDIFNIPPNVLPEVRPSSEVYGKTLKKFFGKKIPIAGILGDQQAALFGQLCLSPGSVKSTFGTGSFIVMNTGDKVVQSNNGLLTTIAWEINGKLNYALEGSVFISGATVQWLRDELKIIKQADEIERLAETEADNGGVYFVPAFTGLGAPHWNQDARGAFFGLTRGVSRGHIARATLEAIAFQNNDVIKTMEEDSGIPISSIRVDGGASANNLLMQLQADILQAKVIRPENIESTTLGVTFAAGLATGIWKNIKEIQTNISNDKIFHPKKSHRMDKEKQMWKKAIERVKDWEDSI